MGAAVSHVNNNHAIHKLIDNIGRMVNLVPSVTAKGFVDLKSTFIIDQILKNTTGFLKAFSDQPEHITSGMSPLKNIMKELQLRKVHIYPRFHEEVKGLLERRKANIIELYQPLTESMVC